MTRRIVGDVIERDRRTVARLLLDLRPWLSRNLTDQIGDTEETGEGHPCRIVGEQAGVRGAGVRVRHCEV